MLTRVGGWLFRHRTVIPLPIAARPARPPGRPARPHRLLLGSGVLIVAAGELLRLLGGPPHRRRFRGREATGSARWSQPDRSAGPQPALPRQHPAVGRVRAERPAALARRPIVAAARARVPRDRPMGGAAARSAARATPTASTCDGAALDSAAATRQPRRRRRGRRSRGARRSSASAARSSRSRRAICLLWLKARLADV